MKINRVDFTNEFLKSIKKLLPQEKLLYLKKYQWFIENSSDPRLKTHRLRGKLEDKMSFSVNYSIRVIFKFVAENKVLFLDIGTHEVYK